MRVTKDHRSPAMVPAWPGERVWEFRGSHRPSATGHQREAGEARRKSKRPLKREMIRSFEHECMVTDCETNLMPFHD
ncbi:hypothetical protein E2C01_076743 [Portunus trituberculatus]|uniref:Uncharacterized protein n=1 Tax=Portunus trituberculatus TaxID=210409 RepID=A0A5B7IMU0_PORTR|nr:hypothetical protein [Portunus trituberculatus]